MTDEQIQAFNEWSRSVWAEYHEAVERITSESADWGRRWFPGLVDYSRAFALARHEAALLRATRRYVAMTARQRKDARRRVEKRTRLSPA